MTTYGWQHAWRATVRSAISLPWSACRPRRRAAAAAAAAPPLRLLRSAHARGRERIDRRVVRARHGRARRQRERARAPRERAQLGQLRGDARVRLAAAQRERAQHRAEAERAVGLAALEGPADEPPEHILGRERRAARNAKSPPPGGEREEGLSFIPDTQRRARARARL